MNNKPATDKLIKIWIDLTASGRFDAALGVRKQIVQEYQINFDDYETDYIIESLTLTGDSPCIVSDYDKRAFSAVGFSWYDYIEYYDQQQYIINIPPDNWHPSIRTALKDFLDNLDEEE